jgi:hypothetical protein
MPAAFGSNTGRSCKHIPLFRLRRLASRPAAANYRSVSFSLVARFLSCKQRPSCAIEDTLPNGISWAGPTVNHCSAHGTWATLLIGVQTTHQCPNGLLPLPVAPSQNAENALANTSSFPLCPDHRPGPSLLRHRQTKGRTRLGRT